MDSHPVFSDFSHMTDGELSQLKFAVGLRTENADEAVRKMLPLSVITPGIKVERVIRTVTKDEICERPDCVARREYLVELDGQNTSLREEVKDAKNRITAAKNKISLTEKSVALTEEKNDVLKAEIEEVQSVISGMEGEVGKSRSHNAGLKSQLNTLQEAINSMRVKVEEDSSLVSVLEGGGNEIVFQSRRTPMTAENKILSKEVNNLSIRDSGGFGYKDADSDSDEE